MPALRAAVEELRHQLRREGDRADKAEATIAGQASLIADAEERARQADQRAQEAEQEAAALRADNVCPIVRRPVGAAQGGVAGWVTRLS